MFPGLVASLNLLLVAVATVGGPVPLLAQQPSSTDLERDVRRAIGSESEHAGIQIAVEGTEVTLRGQVPSLWVESRALQSALAVEGVETIVDELEVPAAESDDELAGRVGRSIANYPYYTLWDYIDGRVVRGVVMLTGSVAPGRDKVGDLLDRIAKIPGVQDVHATIETQPTSSTDDSLRAALASRILGSERFVQYSKMPAPPFHIIVNNSRVTLRGLVRDEIEKRMMEQVARQTFGVLDVVNELGTGW